MSSTPLAVCQMLNLEAGPTEKEDHKGGGLDQAVRGEVHGGRGLTQWTPATQDRPCPFWEGGMEFGQGYARASLLWDELLAVNRSFSTTRQIRTGEVQT